MSTKHQTNKIITLCTDPRRDRHNPFRMICTECQRGEAIAILTEQVVPDPVLVLLVPSQRRLPGIGYDAFQTVHHGKCSVCKTQFVSAGVIWCEQQEDHVLYRRDNDGTTAKMLEQITNPRSSRTES